MSLDLNLEVMSCERWDACELGFLRDNWGRLTAGDIAIALRRSLCSIRWMASKQKLTSRKRLNKFRHDRLVARREYVRLRHKMLSNQAMAEHFGCHVKTIRNDIVQMGLVKVRGPRPSDRIDAVRQWYKRGKTASQLAIEFGCSREAIIGTARDLGLCQPKGARHGG